MTKLRTRMDETQLARQRRTQCTKAWKRGIDFGTSVKGVNFAAVAVDKWHSGFTPSEQRALHSFKVNHAI